MALVRRLPDGWIGTVRAGIFDQTLGRPLNSFRGRTFGLVGFGHIAREVARKLSGFGMKWLVHDPFVSADELAALGIKRFRSKRCCQNRTSSRCIVRSLPSTRHLIGEPQLRQHEAHRDTDQYIARPGRG